MSSVDVIVPCYRYARFLTECVKSVVGQPGVRVRVLIIDDASPDNTAEVATELARQHSQVFFIRHAANKGHIATYNEGIEWASADYMLILSADDYLLPGALEQSVRVMDSHLEVGFTFGNEIVLEDRTDTGQIPKVIETTAYRILTGIQFIELSGSYNIVSTPTAVVRTALQKRVGGYRPELPHAGDLEMWFRLAAQGSVARLEAYQAVYRRHSNNMSSTYLVQNGLADLQQRKTALDCFFQSCDYTSPTRERLRQKALWSLGRQAISLASAALDEGKTEDSVDLSDFALGTCPEAKGSLRWITLTCKRRLGIKTWQVLTASRRQSPPGSTDR